MKCRIATMVGLTVLAFTTMASAQTTPSKTPSKVQGFLDVSIAFTSPATSSFWSEASDKIYNEMATVKFNYKMPSLVGVDLSGGVYLTKQVGFGFGVTSGTGTGSGDVSLTMPHPLYYGYPATGTFNNASMKHSELGVHLFAVVRSNPDKAFQVKVMGGASHYSIKQPLFDDVIYKQVYGFYSPVNTITITSAPTRDVSAGAWGFNIGSDVAYFFTKNVGVGAVLRYGSASVTIPNTASEFIQKNQTQAIKAGGFTFGGGIRTRF